MVSPVRDDFDSGVLDPSWTPLLLGTGTHDYQDSALRCVLDPIQNKQYSNAQITDYHSLPRRSFRWQPPLRMTVRARASHSSQELKGTAGFGFWNEPFVPIGRQLPHLPRAVWFFFGSPPNNMALAQGVPGWGWKAAALDATRLMALLMAPLAPIGFLLMRIPSLYRRLWPFGQRAIGASERLLPVDLDKMHTYELEWLRDTVRFQVDGELVHQTPSAPRGPLGFIAWMDNQYAVVTPQGNFRFGLVAIEHQQWLALDHIEITPL